jgi:outer membrane protein OmpA-like peptidoglycan-associated protein
MAMMAMADTGPYSLIERSDWRRYDNGKYIGLTFREVRASISPKPGTQTNGPAAGGLLYQGNFLVLEETRRDMRQSAQAVDAVIPVSFQLRRDGAVSIENDQGFPRLRGFPTFPKQQIRPGFKWSAPGNRAVDPLNNGQPVIVSFTAEYEYRGVEDYKGTPVYRIVARYSSRYQGSLRVQTPAEGQPFSRIQDSHTVDILIRVSDGLLLFMRDTLDETFSWPDGSRVQFKGFTLTFGAGIIPLDRDTLIASLEHEIHPEPELPPQTPPVDSTPAPEPVAPIVTGLEGDIELTPVPEGIRLTVKDIRFVSNSADFLPTEQPRLDKIAQALKQVPDRTFLVEGHTAATGDPKGEQELSVERAKHMVDELMRRGIPADRLIYKGWGGTKPLGDNATDAGRARNRRVEITILE